MRRILLFIAAGCVLFAGFFYYRITLPVQLPRLPFEFTLNQGMGLRTVANELREAGALRETWSFVLLGRALGKAAAIQAGNYELAAAASPLQLLRRITEGSATQSAVTLVEGWTFRQLRAVLDAQPRLEHDTAGLSDSEILSRIGIQQPAAEGIFFPETYFFAPGASDLSILKRAYHIMDARLAAVWAARAPDLPLSTPYEALILASIVEKEAGRRFNRFPSLIQ